MTNTLSSLCVLGILLTACRTLEFPEDHWFRATNGETVSSPTPVDLDGDGDFEIAIGSFDGFMYVLDDSLRDWPGWPQRVTSGIFSSPAVWDIDSDGAPEIFACSQNGTLFGWHSDGTHTRGFPIQLGGRCWSSPVIINDSLLAVGSLESMHVIDRHSRPAAGWPQKIAGWAAATAAVSGDVLTITTLQLGEGTRGHVYAWHLNGELYPNFPIRLRMDCKSSPALADLDKDGRIEIVVGDDAGYLHVFRLDGSEMPPFPRLIGEAVQSSPAIADIDGDGWLDIVVGTTDGKIARWNALGDAPLGWPVHTGFEVNGSSAIVQSGERELRVVIGSGDGNLYVLRNDGTAVASFPRDCRNDIYSSPLVMDLDSNGLVEIVFGANNGIHLLRDQWRAPQSATTGWPMYHRDPQHSGAQ